MWEKDEGQERWDTIMEKINQNLRLALGIDQYRLLVTKEINSHYL